MMHDMNKVFAQRLKDLLDTADEKQVDLARLLNVTEATVSRYLKGRIPDDVRTLSAIADHFQVTVDYLLGRTDDKKRREASEPGRTNDPKGATHTASTSVETEDDELVVLFRAKVGQLTQKERATIMAILGDDGVGEGKKSDKSVTPSTSSPPGEPAAIGINKPVVMASARNDIEGDDVPESPRILHYTGTGDPVRVVDKDTAEKQGTNSGGSERSVRLVRPADPSPNSPSEKAPVK